MLNVNQRVTNETHISQPYDKNIIDNWHVAGRSDSITTKLNYEDERRSASRMGT